jgi:hypothetical protein
MIGRASAAPVTVRFGSDSPIGAPHTKSSLVLKELVQGRTSGRIEVAIFCGFPARQQRADDQFDQGRDVRCGRDRRIVPHAEPVEHQVGAHLDELLKSSDFVCIACRYNPSTHKLIGKRELGLMKLEAYLINTGRGRIVDESELIKALQEKRIAGAALDVFWNESYWNEPWASEAPWVSEELCSLDNVILSPHNGGATWEVRGRKAAVVARR